MAKKIIMRDPRYMEALFKKKYLNELKKKLQEEIFYNNQTIRIFEGKKYDWRNARSDNGTPLRE